MERHFWRACERETGFSFVELLVTVVIAGIVFAAMVPVFVQAARTSSQDKSRAVALNMAQDAMENARRLAFEEVVDDTWTQQEQTASGSKPFTVRRRVVDQAASASDARVISKEVTITVSWALPNPGGSVTLKTVLYRQYAGPQIVDFTVAPWDADNEWLTDSTVQLDAVINAADIGSMEPVDVGGITIAGKVDFMITSVKSGIVIPTISVPCTGANQSTYTASWTAPGSGGVSDGYWSFKAVAFSAQKYPGNTWEFVKRIESGPPAAVTNLKATAGSNWVTLTWSPTVSMDLDHYILERTNLDGSNKVTLVDAAAKSKATGFTDSGLPTDTQYRYTVYAIDQVGKVSSAATVAAGTGVYAAVQPAPATNLAVVGFGSAAKLTWTASASAGVTGYLVYKDGNTVTSAASVSTPYCTITQGWSTTATYQVKPIASGSNPSLTLFASLTPGPPAPDFQVISGVNWIRLALGTQQTFTLNVMNNVQSGKSATITLKYIGLQGSDPGVVINPVYSNLAYSSTAYAATWSGLVEGFYQFSWKTSTNKTGSRVVQLTPPTLTYNEKCIP